MTMMFAVAVILLFGGAVESYVMTRFASLQCNSKNSYNRRVSGLSMASEEELWKEQVEYLNLDSAMGPVSTTAKTIPLFLLGGTFYPTGFTALRVFEMKYRTMMFDIAKGDDTFGYAHIDEFGRFGTVGTLCTVTDRNLNDDGCQEIYIRGDSRFKITRILKTSPYMVAEVEPEMLDIVPADEIFARKLELEAYTTLKYYIRLMRSYGPNASMVVSQAIKRSRPTLIGKESDPLRRTDFSFALANMISMSQTVESQLILQTTDVVKRLSAEKEILIQACDMISEQLIGMELLTAAVKDSIKFETYNNDTEDDILPGEVIQDGKDVEKDEWDMSNME